MSKLDLSIAIIFKDEIRCLERCLKSVQPLRKHLSVQIVMADTGSTDGSRAVAEQYADVLFDFPWINDFSAARNATLERCKGRWALVMDCDEWLDSNVSELERFLFSPQAKNARSAEVVIRNYYESTLESYGDFFNPRLLRLNAVPYYYGIIHEFPLFDGKADQKGAVLKSVVLHHDGYIMLNDGSEAGKRKKARNKDLMRSELERNPDDLRTLSHMIDCEDNVPSRYALLRRAVSLACENPKRGYSPFIVRDAVYYAYHDCLPEMNEWIERAETLFSKSYLTRIDVNYLRAKRACDKGDYKEGVRCGEAYLRAYQEYESERNKNTRQMSLGMLCYFNESAHGDMQIAVAKAYHKLEGYEAAYETLRDMRWNQLNAEQTSRLVVLLGELYVNSGSVTDELITRLWDGIQNERISNEKTDRRLDFFLKSGRALFDYTEEKRAPWRIFLPLHGDCLLGDYAALMTAETSEEADELLGELDNLAELPAAAFVHALKLGAEFPLPGKPLSMELADVMANKLSTDAAFLREAVLFTADAFESDGDLNWARAMALAALQGNEWKGDADPLPLLRAFARIESAFLARCYSEYALRIPDFLPPLHRFGLHLANAFATLFPADISPEFTPTMTGGIRGALGELKEAVVAAPDQKAVVDKILTEIMNEL